MLTNDLVSIDESSGGYPYSGERVMPKFWTSYKEITDTLKQYKEMKLFTDSTEICSIDL